MSSPPGRFQLSPALEAVLAELGFEQLTPIQAQVIPILLAGSDLVARAPTGSGKTAAFALPILEQLQLEPRHLTALVLCPTRELCAQIVREFRRFGRRHPGLRVAGLAGGEPLREQAQALAGGVHVAVGTPGRVLDHLRRRTLRVHAVCLVVLDEGDRMLDMGFEKDVEAILAALPHDRQTALFSATLPESIEALSNRHQRSPVFVQVEADVTFAAALQQWLLLVEADQKFEALSWALRTYAHESVLVFVNLKRTAAELEARLAVQGVSVASLHGDLEQPDRDRVLAKFRNQSTRVLVATDVAARGLDVEELDLVVNFELPLQADVYLHRVGRTARAGAAGVAVSLCAPAELEALRAIEQRLGAPIARAAGWPPERGSRSEPTLPGAAQRETLRISGGRKDKLRPGDILGALTGEAGALNAADVGKIEIHDHFAFVAVAGGLGRTAQQRLSSGRIKGKRFKVTLLT